jgi:hypothetical protein
MKDPVKANIPIIALTANALKGDSEKYKAAGMNDYLAKPFNEEKLFQVISKHILHDDSIINYQEMKQTIKKVPDSEKLYDLSIITSVSGGDEAFVMKMLALFIETVPENLKELNLALDQKNWDMVSKMAHKLKSTLDSMGIQTLKQDVRTVEMNAKKLEGLDEVPVLVGKINLIVNTCIEQLQVYLNSNQDSDSGN